MEDSNGVKREDLRTRLRYVVGERLSSAYAVWNGIIGRVRLESRAVPSSSKGGPGCSSSLAKKGSIPQHQLFREGHVGVS